MNKKPAKQKIRSSLWVIATIVLSIASSIAAESVLQLKTPFITKLGTDYPYLKIIIPLVIAIIAAIIIKSSDSNATASEDEIDKKSRLDVIKALMVIYKDRLDKKMDEETFFRIELDLESLGEGKITKFIVDSAGDKKVKGLDGLVNLFATKLQRLSVLGDAGAGKSVLMLNIAIKLLELAQQDEKFPMPFILDLSTLEYIANPTLSLEPFEPWLEKNIRMDYGLERKQVRQMLAKCQILPLLDGLDEVYHPYAGDIQTVLEQIAPYLGNVRKYYLRVYPNFKLPEILICCRKREYDEAWHYHPESFTQLHAVLTIQPIKLVFNELARLAEMDTDGPASKLLPVVRQYPPLHDVLNTAFNFHIALKLAKPNVDLTRIATSQQLLDMYINHQLKQMEPAYDVQTSKNCLTWFANKARGNYKSTKFTLRSLRGGNVDSKKLGWLFSIVDVFIGLLLGTYLDYLAGKYFNFHRHFLMIFGIVVWTTLIPTMSNNERDYKWSDLLPRWHLFSWKNLWHWGGFALAIYCAIRYYDIYVIALLVVLMIPAYLCGDWLYPYKFRDEYKSSHGLTTLTVNFVKLSLTSAASILGYLIVIYAVAKKNPGVEKYVDQFRIAPLLNIHYSYIIIFHVVLFYTLLITIPSSFWLDYQLTKIIWGLEKGMPYRIRKFLTLAAKNGLIEDEVHDLYRFRHILIMEKFQEHKYADVSSLDILYDGDKPVAIDHE
jgi:hypothetical protein